MNDPLRGTGRTTRMLAEAKRLSGLGNRVYVIALNVRQMRDFEVRLRDKLIRVTTISYCRTRIDWDEESKRFHGDTENTIALIDHSVFEHDHTKGIKQ